MAIAPIKAWQPASPPCIVALYYYTVVMAPNSAWRPASPPLLGVLKSDNDKYFKEN
jgi:hypothetical protein